MIKTGSANGKIILAGEYAVVFGFKGIAIPSPFKIEVTFEEDRLSEGIKIEWKEIIGNDNWNSYLKDILSSIQQFKGGIIQGKLTIKNQIPLGKGMGSSTALIIAVCRCFLGDSRFEALAIENKLTPNNSGIDFNAIWENNPILFSKKEGHQKINISKNLLNDIILIDTGVPNESTKEMIKWISARRNSKSQCSIAINNALKVIDNCTKRLAKGAELVKIIPDNYRAQLSLGIVPLQVQNLIEQIEQFGGVAKIIGAGGKTGGGGIVLAIHKNPKKLMKLITTSFTITPYELKLIHPLI